MYTVAKRHNWYKNNSEITIHKFYLRKKYNDVSFIDADSKSANEYWTTQLIR